MKAPEIAITTMFVGNSRLQARGAIYPSYAYTNFDVLPWYFVYYSFAPITHTRYDQLPDFITNTASLHNYKRVIVATLVNEAYISLSTIYRVARSILITPRIVSYEKWLDNYFIFPYVN